MSDLGPLLAQTPTQPEVSLGEAFGALGSGEPEAPTPGPSAPLLTSPVPATPRQVYSPAEVVKDWHQDPVRQGMAEGFVSSYASQSSGGLPEAAQHLDTFGQAISQGLVKDQGDDASTVALWNKFRSSPESLKPDEAASLAEKIRQVGSATQGAPGLRYDPIGKVSAIGADGSVKVSYPAVAGSGELDLQPLAPTGLNNLRRLAAIGEGATRSATVGDVLPAYLGTEAGRPSKHQLGDLTGAINLIAQESGSDPQAVMNAVAAGWESIASKTKPWEKPFALALNGPNPAAEALDDRLSTRLVDAMKGGVSSLDFTGGSGLSVTSDPSGQLAVSGDVTLQHTKLLRHLYPALTSGGTTAWLPSKPAVVPDVTRLNGHVTVLNGPVLEQMGGHPGMQPGEHIVFEKPRKMATRLPSQPLGPVQSKQPEFSLERLGPNDINPDEFTGASSPLFTHAWAVVPGGNSVKVQASQQGFKPISHMIGDEPHQLIFGISPAQARKLSSGTIVTNKGTWGPDGLRPGGGVSFDNPPVPSSTELLGGSVQWHLAPGDGDEPDPEADDGIEDTQVKTQLEMLKDVPDLAQALTALKNAGVKNLRVYSHRTQVPGFKTAFEHVFSDGLNVGSVLSPTHSNDAHVVPVFVPENWHLPAQPGQTPSVRHGSVGTQINGVSILTNGQPNSLKDLKEKFLAASGDALLPSDDPTPVRLSGGVARLSEPSPDSAAVARLVQAAGGQVEGFQPAKADVADKAAALTISGSKVPALRRTRPDPSWADRHGIEFDPSWRRGDGLVTLPPSVASAFSDVYSSFTDQHPAAAKLWNLSKIGMSTGYSDSPTYTEWGRLGGAIGLSTSHWADTSKLAAQVADYHAHGVTAGDSLGYLLAHELGHVVGGALQFGSDGSGAASALAKIRASAGRDGIMRGLSKVAWQSSEEMVAESVASGLVGRPSSLALDVLDVLDKAYRRVMAARSSHA